MSSEQQTGALHHMEEEVAAEWAAVLEHLSPYELRFALNASQDTLCMFATVFFMAVVGYILFMVFFV